MWGNFVGCNYNIDNFDNMKTNIIHCGDALKVLSSIQDESINCVVTSPPYWGLRDYGHDGQMGLEKTPQEYVEKMVMVFREIKRVLKNDGTVWLNLGDSYSGSGKGGQSEEKRSINWQPKYGQSQKITAETKPAGKKRTVDDYKPKDLIGIPWMVAFALRSDGWYLRQDIIWAKPNPMPESVKDRCTKSHEHIFLLSKSAKYYFDQEAIREKAKDTSVLRAYKTPAGWDTSVGDGGHGSFHKNGREKGHVKFKQLPGYGGGGNGFAGHSGNRTSYGKIHITANKRSVWTVATKPYKEAHYATFPTELIKPCILAGCPENGIVLDPFIGSGTTAEVALTYNRYFIGIEINPENIKLIEKRINPILNQMTIFENV